MFGQLGQNFAIQFNLIFFQETREAAIREAERADGGVDLNLPQRPGGALFLAPMAEGMRAGVKQGRFRFALFLASAETITLHPFENSAAASGGGDPSFYSWHGFRLSASSAQAFSG